MIRVATSQFAVSADIESNLKSILSQMREAKEKNCDVIQFPEGSLSGYAGSDFASFDNFNWPLLRQCMSTVLLTAKELNLWVLLGSAHQLTHPNKPHNSIYVINNLGEIVDRYDKRFCAGTDHVNHGDLSHYSSGNHFAIFSISGITCSTLICHDYRYPELYRELKKKNVEIVFHCYHAGNMDEKKRLSMEAEIGAEYHHLNPGKTYPEITMPATMISYAANTYVWISCANTSAKESCWPAFIVRPDGVIIGKLEKNVASILVTEIDTKKEFYDSTKYWRNRSISGIYFSGVDNPVEDPRSSDKKSF